MTSRLSTQNRQKLIETAVQIQEQGVLEAEKLGFGSRCFVVTCLPYRNPKPEQLVNGCWMRTSGRYSLWVQGGPNGIPYGSYPRLFLIWLTSEVRSRGSRKIVLGNSFRAFCKKLLLDTSSGKNGAGRRLAEQIDKLLEARIGFFDKTENSGLKGRMQLSDDHEMFWEKDVSSEHPSFSDAKIILSQKFYDELTKHCIPIDLRAIAQLKQSAQALDIYQWLAQRMYGLQRSGEKSVRPSWEQLNQQFGGNYSSLKHFKADFIDKLKMVKAVYQEANVMPQPEGLLLLKSQTPVPSRKIVS